MLITFAFGNHTFRVFAERPRALEYLNDLWDEEGQLQLLNLVQVDIERDGKVIRVERFPFGGVSKSLGGFMNAAEDELLC